MGGVWENPTQHLRLRHRSPSRRGRALPLPRERHMTTNGGAEEMKSECAS